MSCSCEAIWTPGELSIEGPLVEGSYGFPGDSKAWLDVGEPPPEVEASSRARLKKARSLGSTLSGVLVGGLAGVAALTTWPGALSWPIAQESELYAVFAVPVGVASFAGNWWMIPRYARATPMPVRRVALSEGKLYMEEASGRTSDASIYRVGLSTEPIARDWYAVTLFTPRPPRRFYVPTQVASAIRAARNRRR